MIRTIRMRIIPVISIITSSAHNTRRSRIGGAGCVPSRRPVINGAPRRGRTSRIWPVCGPLNSNRPLRRPVDRPLRCCCCRALRSPAGDRSLGSGPGLRRPVYRIPLYHRPWLLAVNRSMLHRLLGLLPLYYRLTRPLPCRLIWPLRLLSLRGRLRPLLSGCLWACLRMLFLRACLGRDHKTAKQ
jgi:hypothetical protein